jgi:hypothetical protein
MQRWAIFWTAVGSLAAVVAAFAAVVALNHPDATIPPATNGAATQPVATRDATSPARTPIAPPCVFAFQQVVTCASDDPTVEVDAVWFGDNTGCFVRFLIAWGDGSPPQTVTTQGSNNRQTFAARHTYQTAGSFLIDTHTLVLSGACTGSDAHFEFTHV